MKEKKIAIYYTAKKDIKKIRYTAKIKKTKWYIKLFFSINRQQLSLFHFPQLPTSHNQQLSRK